MQTRVDSRPLTAHYKYPHGCRPGRAIVLSPLLVTEIQPGLSPKKVNAATRRGKNRRCTHSLLSTIVGLVSIPASSPPLASDPPNFKSQFEAENKLYNLNMYGATGRGRRGKRSTLPFSFKIITEPQSLFGF